jgi:hypothetical protein
MKNIHRTNGAIDREGRNRAAQAVIHRMDRKTVSRTTPGVDGPMPSLTYRP